MFWMMVLLLVFCGGGAVYCIRGYFKGMGLKIDFGILLSPLLRSTLQKPYLGPMQIISPKKATSFEKTMMLGLGIVGVLLFIFLVYFMVAYWGMVIQ